MLILQLHTYISIFIMHEFDECDFNQMSIFSRIPYSSLSAFLLCLSGITLFFLMIFWSFNSSIEQFRRTFNVMDISWLDKVFFIWFFCNFRNFCVSVAGIGFSLGMRIDIKILVLQTATGEHAVIFVFICR